MSRKNRVYIKRVVYMVAIIAVVVACYANAAAHRDDEPIIPTEPVVRTAAKTDDKPSVSDDEIVIIPAPAWGVEPMEPSEPFEISTLVMTYGAAAPNAVQLPDPSTAENAVEDDSPYPGAICLGDFRVTYYCAELYPHICGTGDGITASGRKLEPYYSAAVDPELIPLGTKLAVDFGDGELHFYRADDVGPAVKGKHIDLAVQGHEEALSETRVSATVYVLP